MDLDLTTDVDPLKTLGEMAAARGWTYEREADYASMVMQGKADTYGVAFDYSDAALIIACTFSFDVPKRYRARVRKLLPQLNSDMRVGYFDLVPGEGFIVYKNNLLGPDGSHQQCELLLYTAVNACDGFHPLFWRAARGMEINSIIDLCAMEPAGNA